MNIAAAQPLALDELADAWFGAITWREVAGLRGHLFDLLEVPGRSGLRLDVRGVTIDTPGDIPALGPRRRLRDGFGEHRRGCPLRRRVRDGPRSS